MLHISGEGRSGSALLGSLLGRRRGWFSAGEVRYLWQRGLIERRLWMQIPSAGLPGVVGRLVDGLRERRRR